MTVVVTATVGGVFPANLLLAGSALPTGGQFVAGAGAIKPTPNGLAIGQTSPHAIINWQSFSIGQGNGVQFNNGAGATLNRVTGGDLSKISGSLTATGSVYLVNPQGVVVGPSGRVVTGGSFVASTRDVSNDAFMGGAALRFRGNSAGDVSNAGQIVSQNGDVVLLGRSVSNSGQIAAANGRAVLAAGDDILLRPASGDPRIVVKAGAGDVTNTGTIVAAAAQLAAANGNVYALAGNTSNTIAASGIATINGQVWLVAPKGTVSVDSTVAARNADGSGGRIISRGENIAVRPSATLDVSASGTGNGGAISIKSHPVRGQGGDTSFAGTALALGAGGGTGGTVETSGHTLSITGGVVKAGQWLLDPVDLLVDANAATTLNASLAAGSNVTLTTNVTGATGPGTQSSGAGDITVAAPLSWASSAALSLSAFRNININAVINSAANGTLTLRADNTGTGTGTINFNNGAQVSIGPNGSASFLFNSQDNTSNKAVNPVSYTNPQSYAVNVTLGSGALLFQSLLVNTPYDLQNIQNNLGQNYALGADIDASATGSSLFKFTPIGTSAAPFVGLLDGQSHSINRLTITSSASNVGLFGVIGPQGLVQNLTLAGESVSGTASSGANIGGLAGSNAGIVVRVNAVTKTIGSSTFGSVVSADNSNNTTGGLVGANSGLIFSSSTAGLSVSGGNGSNGTTGGVAGVNSGTIDGVTGTGVSGGLLVGGIAGDNSGSITLANVTSSSSGTPVPNAIFGYLGIVGGLVGQNEAGGSITNSTIQSGAGVGGDVAGGIAGANAGLIANSSASGVAVTGTTTAAGGLAGINTGTIDQSTVSDIFARLLAPTLANSLKSAAFVGDNSGAITNSAATATQKTLLVISTNAENLAGLVGTNEQTGLIQNSYATGPAAASGGLVADNFGLITNSYASGIVKSFGAGAGGLVGTNEATGIITASYATGAVDSGNSGGLVSLNKGSISQSYASGQIVGGAGSGVVFNNQGTITTSYWDSGTTGVAAGVQIGSKTGVTDVGGAPFDPKSYPGFDFANIWAIFPGSTRPILRSEYSTTVTNAHQLQLIALDPTAAYTLGNAIDVSETLLPSGVWNVRSGFAPIGNIAAPFTGSLDGQGNTVNNLFILATDTTAGLFGAIGSKGTVQNLTVNGDVYAPFDNAALGIVAGVNAGAVTNVSAGGSVIGGGNAASLGGLVGANRGTITQSFAGPVVLGGPNSAAGGLVGNNAGGTITASGAYGAVSAGGGSVIGGLVGFNSSGTISQSSAGGLIADAQSANGPSVATTTPAALGGLVGWNQGGRIDQSFASGSVTESLGSGYAGGFVGYNTSTISNSLSLASVSGTGTDQVGGFVGANGVGGTISQSIALGSVIGGSATGAFAGSNQGIITNSFADTISAGQLRLVGFGSSAGVADVSLGVGDPASYAGLDFSGVWVLLNGGSIPLLRAAYSTTIHDPLQLQLMALDTTASYTLAQDIDASALTPFGFIPIGSPVQPFTGSLQGNGHVVSNLTFSSPFPATGLFGDIGATGRVSGLGVANASITATAGGDAGVLAGINQGTLTLDYATGTLTGGGVLGGMVGLNSGLITNSYAIVAVSGGAGSTVGGFVGTNSGDIGNTYAAGKVTAGPGSTLGGYAGLNTGFLGSGDTFGATFNSNRWFGALSGTSVGIGQDKNSGQTLLGNAPTPSNQAPGIGTLSNPGALSGIFYFPAGSGTGALPILTSEYETTITNSHQLMLVTLDPSASYLLGANFTWQGPAASGIDSSATGISTSLGPGSPGGFTGIFNGEGYTISGLNTPLFLAIGASAEVGNLTLANVNLTVSATDGGFTSYHGEDNELGVLANANAGLIANVAATGAFTINYNGVQNPKPPFTGKTLAGGLIALNTGTILDATSQINVTVAGPIGFDAVGGVAGYNQGTIAFSAASGAVRNADTPSSSIGGLAGYSNGLVRDSTAAGLVTGGGNCCGVGGLIGRNDGIVIGSSASSAVIGDSDAVFVGGLIGVNSGTILTSSATGTATILGSNGAVGGLVGNNNLGAYVEQPQNAATISFANPSDSAGTVIGFGQSTTAPSPSLCISSNLI